MAEVVIKKSPGLLAAGRADQAQPDNSGFYAPESTLYLLTAGLSTQKPGLAFAARRRKIAEVPGGHKW